MSALTSRPVPNPPLENANRVVWRLAGPAVALNILQVVNSLLDNLFLGHLPPAALTAVAASSSLMFLFFSVGFALGTAPTALVARAFGAGNHAEYRTANRKGLSLAVMAGVLSVALMLPVIPLGQRLLVPGDNPEAARLFAQYLGAYAFGLPALYVIQALAGSLRGIGDTKSPMVISGIQILLHIALNFVLIFPSHDLGWIVIPGAGMGVLGAGLALTISAWFAAIVYLIWAGKTPLGECWRLSWPGREWTHRILRIAIPAGMMSVVRVLSYTALTLILVRVPDSSAALSAMRLGFSIEALAYMPAFGLTVAAQALVGQSLGMKDPERASRLGWLAAHHSAVVSTVVAVLLMVFAVPICTMLVPEQPDVARIAVTYIWFVLATETLFSYGMVLTGAIQGAGDTMRPFWATLATLWGVRIPLAVMLALPLVLGSIPGLGLGANGVWIAMSVSQSVNGLVMMWLFRQGRWKLTRV